MMVSTHATMNLSPLRKLQPFSPRLHSFMSASKQAFFLSPSQTHHHLHSCSLHIPQPQSTSLNPPPKPLPSPLVVVSFYKFADIPDCAQKCQPLKDLCEQLRVSGGIILAPEGINGSICGSRDAVERILGSIQADERLANLRQTESPASDEEEEIHHGHTEKSPLGAGDDAPFRWGHVRVKLKNELVPLGLPGVSPAKKVGKYVKPKDWNSLIQQPGTMVVDVRNSYEIRIGKFKGAVDPETTGFREFPSWVEDRLLKQMESVRHCTTNSEDFEEKMTTSMPQRIAMYCTGGIRCEKATSFLMGKGFTEVYHLEGGILKYLEEVPFNESMWQGECFVFDKRVSVEHGLKQGTYKLCYACKKPVSDEDMLSVDWEDGVSCPHCAHIKSEKEKARARARQKQVETWGLVGGPDKGRRRVQKQSQGQGRCSDSELSKSV